VEHVASIFRVEKQAKQEISVKTSGKQSHRLADFSDYTGNRREMSDIESVPVGAPAGKNELPVPIGSLSQRAHQ
jgi:hypothetical protein